MAKSRRKPKLVDAARIRDRLEIEAIGPGPEPEPWQPPNFPSAPHLRYWAKGELQACREVWDSGEHADAMQRGQQAVEHVYHWTHLRLGWEEDTPQPKTIDELAELIDQALTFVLRFSPSVRKNLARGRPAYIETHYGSVEEHEAAIARWRHLYSEIVARGGKLSKRQICKLISDRSGVIDKDTKKAFSARTIERHLKSEFDTWPRVEKSREN
jgi:hypothetical protein